MKPTSSSWSGSGFTRGSEAGFGQGYPVYPGYGQGQGQGAALRNQVGPHAGPQAGPQVGKMSTTTTNPPVLKTALEEEITNTEASCRYDPTLTWLADPKKIYLIPKRIRNKQANTNGKLSRPVSIVGDRTRDSNVGATGMFVGQKSVQKSSPSGNFMMNIPKPIQITSPVHNTDPQKYNISRPVHISVTGPLQQQQQQQQHQQQVQRSSLSLTLHGRNRIHSMHHTRHTRHTRHKGTYNRRGHKIIIHKDFQNPTCSTRHIRNM